MSASIATAVPPSPSISDASSSRRSLRRAPSATAAPSATIALAVASPIPDEAPVIRTLRPSSEPIGADYIRGLSRSPGVLRPPAPAQRRGAPEHRGEQRDRGAAIAASAAAASARARARPGRRGRRRLGALPLSASTLSIQPLDRRQGDAVGVDGGDRGRVLADAEGALEMPALWGRCGAPGWVFVVDPALDRQPSELVEHARAGSPNRSRLRVVDRWCSRMSRSSGRIVAAGARRSLVTEAKAPGGAAPANSFARRSGRSEPVELR